MGWVEEVPVQAARPPAWRQFSMVMIIMAAGLLMVGVADAGAWHQAGWAAPLFYAGLALVYATPAFRMLSRGAGRGERLALVVMLGIALYAVKVMHAPSMFTFRDEFGHWRTTSDILASHHLFSNNPVVGAYSYYPGLEIATAALVKLTGLSIFQAGLLAVGAARLVLAGSIFWLMEEVLGTAWLAGIAALIYMANPNFLFFDAQFAYESLALPMATAVVWLTVRWVRADGRAAWVWAVIGGTVLAALVPVHHMTSYAVVAVLGTWAAGSVALDRKAARASTRRIALAAACSLILTLDWNRAVAGHATAQESGGDTAQRLGGPA